MAEVIRAVQLMNVGRKTKTLDNGHRQVSIKPGDGLVFTEDYWLKFQKEFHLDEIVSDPGRTLEIRYVDFDSATGKEI